MSEGRRGAALFPWLSGGSCQWGLSQTIFRGREQQACAAVWARPKSTDALDIRTRHSHRQLDGERREVGEKFSNGCRYPGDPQTPHAEVCNCRCTLVAAVDGVDQSKADR